MGYQRFKDANRQKDARRWSAGMECSLPTGRDWWFPLPRPETRGPVGWFSLEYRFLFCRKRRMGEHRDGAPIRSPCAEPFNETREANWLDFRVMMSQICTIWKIRNLQKMDKLLKYNGTPCRFEPTTYGLEGRCSINWAKGALRSDYFMQMNRVNYTVSACWVNAFVSVAGEVYECWFFCLFKGIQKSPGNNSAHETPDLGIHVFRIFMILLNIPLPSSGSGTL